MSNVRIANDSAAAERFSIEWGPPGEYSPFEQVLRDGVRLPSVEVDDAQNSRLSGIGSPTLPRHFQCFIGSAKATHRDLGFRWNAKACLRRRLSEVRDNYLSRNQNVLTVAKSFTHRFLN